MEFNKLNFAVDGDSITAWQQWSYQVYKNLEFATHFNVAVGSSVWYKRGFTKNGKSVFTQDYNSPDFAGISDGWEDTDDMDEMQKRMNNCAVVHIQRYLSEVKAGNTPPPDVFAFAMGTNDALDCLGDPEKAMMGKDILDNPNIDLFTEAGAMRWCIQTIMTEFPNAKIFALTPIQTATPEHNRKIEKTIEVMKKVCGGLSVQIIDCFNNCGISEKFEVIGGKGRYLQDGLHPDVVGQTLHGDFVTKEIRNNLF